MIKFVGCIAKQADRRTISIPKELHKEVEKLLGKQLKITIEEIKL
ncbi:MAG TPA: hypothetical protein VNK25_00495 [Candidatus Nitrosotenuis sp.]|jgi:hypothetical protein|nr:hypothetical protein [Candidatus Nitrosotenuis sp.]